MQMCTDGTNQAVQHTGTDEYSILRKHVNYENVKDKCNANVLINNIQLQVCQCRWFSFSCSGQTGLTFFIIV